MILNRKFYAQNAQIVAKKLLGTFLVHETPAGKLVGQIVETEAYLSSNDPASHSYKGQTLRNQAMFLEGGHIYIYFSYGFHYLLNVVTGKESVGEAVLIRAIEPVAGINLMQNNRQMEKISNLTNGPGKLVQALNIGNDLYGQSFISSPLKIYSADSFPELFRNRKFEVVTTTRIGISKGNNLNLRFYIMNNPFVSKS